MVKFTTENGAPISSRTPKAYDDGGYDPIRRWARGCFIKKGGMGDIFVGKNVDNGQLFLIKSVASQPAWSKPLAALQNEDKILRKLSKKNCPNIFRPVGNATSESVAEMGGKPTLDLFLEFAMARGNLTEIVQRAEKLTESVARAYTYQILQALSCMHRHGIVHCDIQCTNIVICERGVKVVDFGLAKDVRPDPPQCHRRPSTDPPQALVDPPPESQQDIRALGLVVYEMVTGHHPTIDQSSSTVEKVLRSLEENYGLTKTMPHCMAFIQSCLGTPDSGSDVRGEEASVTLRQGAWTADRLLRHPWMESFTSDLTTSDEEGHSLTPPLLPMMTDVNTAVTSAATEPSPRVTSLKKCAGKLCCQKMDADAVVPPLSARSLNSPRKRHKLTRVFTLPN